MVTTEFPLCSFVNNCTAKCIDVYLFVVVLFVCIWYTIVQNKRCQSGFGSHFVNCWDVRSFHLHSTRESFQKNTKCASNNFGVLFTINIYLSFSIIHSSFSLFIWSSWIKTTHVIQVQALLGKNMTGSHTIIHRQFHILGKRHHHTRRRTRPSHLALV